MVVNIYTKGKNSFFAKGDKVVNGNINLRTCDSWNKNKEAKKGPIIGPFKNFNNNVFYPSLWGFKTGGTYTYGDQQYKNPKGTLYIGNGESTTKSGGGMGFGVSHACGIFNVEIDPASRKLGSGTWSYNWTSSNFEEVETKKGQFEQRKTGETQHPGTGYLAKIEHGNGAAGGGSNGIMSEAIKITFTFTEK